MQKKWVVEQHHVHFVPPDRVEVRLRGIMTAEHVKTVNRIYEEIRCDHGPFFILVDTQGVQGFTAEARATFSKTPRKYPFRHMAIVVASTRLRTVISMVFRACRLLAPKLFDFPVEFFSSRREASARLDAVSEATRTLV